jgi:hypothetical protein
MTTKRRLADDLRIPTNPLYDHDVEPEENPYQFWNPVSATNTLVVLANAALEIAQAVNDEMSARTVTWRRKKEVEKEIERVEQSLIVKDPLTPTEAKTIKLVASAIWRRALDQGIAEQLQALYDERDVLEWRHNEHDERIEAGLMWNKTNEKVSDNVRSALSFYKDEKKRAYQF